MDNPEKLATQGTQNEEKQNEKTICVGHHYAQKKPTNNAQIWIRTQLYAEIVTDITTRNSERKYT